MLWDDLFTARSLTKAISMIESPPQLVLSTFFGRQVRQPTSTMAWDIIEGSEGLLPNIPADAPNTVTTKTIKTTVTAKAPRLAPSRLISLADLEDIRAIGGTEALETMADRIKRELTDMKGEIDRTREYYAAQAMTGVVKDSDGVTVLYNFALPAAHTVNLAGNDLWSDSANSDPIGDIRTWCGLIADAIGAQKIQGFTAFAASDVINSLIKHDHVTDLVKTAIGVKIALEGKLEKLGGVNIVEYRGKYKDTSGTTQRFVPTGYFRLGAQTTDLSEEYYAPPVQWTEGGVGSNQKAKMYAVDSEVKKNPAGIWLYGESRPLPAPLHSSLFVNSKVQ